MKQTPRSNLLDRPDPNSDFTKVIEARDFLRVHLPRLSDKQRKTLIAWAGGKSCREIASEEGVSEAAVHQRLSGGLRRLKELTQ